MLRGFFSLLFLTFLCTGTSALLGINQSSGLSAQTQPANTYGYGAARSETAVLGISDAIAIDQLMFYIPGVGSPSREELLRQNIKSYMMPIRQSPTPGMEWAYALAGAVEYYQNLNTNFKDNLSPDYITLSLAYQGNAPSITDGLKLLVKQGTVSAAIVPYGSPVIPNAVYSVPKFSIANFGYLFQPETRARNRVFETRKALSRGNPVIVELLTDASFINLRNGNYTTAQPGAEAHYLTVVGYDSEAETFELRGVFGRLWANAGYVRISYDDFGRLAKTGYVLFPNPSK